jgi:hypothetical protein
VQHRILGRTGLHVSEIGVGGAPFGISNYLGKWDPGSPIAENLTTETIHRALDLGYTYFDTAPGYGDGRSEELMGKALAGHRSDVIVATKVTRGQWSPEEIYASVEGSLRRLRTDVIDILQFHGDSTWGWYLNGEDKLILERGGIEAFERLREQGKIRFLGFTCEGPSSGVERLIASGLFDTMQVRYNIMHLHASDFVNERGIIRQADAKGMGILVMRPMTSGVFQRLMAAHFPGIDMREVGKLMLSYVLSDPYIDVALVGMREPELAEHNAAISDELESRLDMEEVHTRFPG